MKLKLESIHRNLWLRGLARSALFTAGSAGSSPVDEARRILLRLVVNSSHRSMAESKERWQQQACSANERVPSPTQHAHSVSCSDRSVLHFKAETSVQADGMSDLLAGVSQFPVSETTVTNDLEDQSLPQYWPDMEINHDGMYHVTDEGDGSGAWLPSPQGLADEPTHSDVSTITMVPEPKVEVKPQQPCFEAPSILTTEKILYEIQNDEKIASLLGKYPKYNRVLVYYYLYKGMRTQEKDNPLIAEAAEKAGVTYQHAYNFIGNFRRSIGASRHRGQRIWTPWTKNSPGKAAASPAGLPSSLPGVLQPEENHDGLGLSMEENHTGLLERMEGESPPSGGEASVVDPCMTRMDGMNSGTNFLNELKQDPEIAKQLERFPKYNGVLVYYYLYKGMRTQEKDNSLIAEASEKAGVTYQHAYYFIGNFRRATGESRTRMRRDAGPWDPPHFPYPGPLQQHLTQYGQSGSPSLESASTDGHDADGSSELTEGTLGTSTGYRDGCEERGEGDGLVGPPSDGAMWGACTTSPFRGCGQEMELVTETDRILEKLKANKDIARRLERFPKYNRVLAYYYLYKGMRTQEKDNPLIAEAAEKAGVTYQHAYNFIGNFRRATGGSKVRGARLGMTCVSGVTGSVDKGVEQLHGCRKRRKGGTMLGWSPQASPAQALETVGYPGGDRTGDDSADSFGIIRQNLQRIQQLMEDNQRYGCEGLAMAFCFQPSTAHTQEPLLWVLGSPEGKSLLAEHRIGDYVALLWRAKRIRDVEIKKMESNADNSKALDELGQWDEAEKDSTALPQSADCGHEVPNASTSEPGPSPPNQPLRTNRRLPSTSSGGGWNARPHCHMEQGHGHQ